MNKLEIKHLAPYLPYGLKVKTVYGFDTMRTLNEFVINGDHEEFYSYEEEPECLPILYPLSSLTKPIWHEEKEFVPVDKIREILIQIDGKHYHFDYSRHDGYAHRFVFDGVEMGALALPFHIVQNLYEWKFDIHGLIEKGLAIDANSLDTNPYK